MNGTEIANYLAGKVTILPFHRRWLGRVFAPNVQIGVLSCTRGSAKTWLFGNLAAASITPDSPLFERGRGVETLIVSASLEQSRTMLGFVREALGDDADREYRFLDSGQRLAVTHKATNTRLRVLSGQLHAHHLRPVALHPHEDIAFHLDPKWIVTLCRACHYDKRTHPFIPKTQYQRDVAAWDRAVREL